MTGDDTWLEFIKPFFWGITIALTLNTLACCTEWSQPDPTTTTAYRACRHFCGNQGFKVRDAVNYKGADRRWCTCDSGEQKEVF